MRISSIFAFSITAFATILASRADGTAVPSYTFLGRIVDASHAAFDTNRTATVSAYSTDGALLAETRTVFYADSRVNYALKIPMATAAAEGYAVQKAQLTLMVTDDEQRTWEGVVPLSASIVGEPGGVKEIDIVLAGESTNGCGIDDELYWSLYYEWLEWVSSGNGDFSAGFDPTVDHDGDGVPTLQEAYAGTNPFDASSCLRITMFTSAGGGSEGDEITFTAVGARAYVVESATNLAPSAVWTQTGFTVLSDGAGGTVATASSEVQDVISYPASVRAATPTVHLRPVASPRRFYRIRQK